MTSDGREYEVRRNGKGNWQSTDSVERNRSSSHVTRLEEIEIEDPGIQASSEKMDKKQNSSEASIPYRKLFRYADKLDWTCIVIGTVAGIIHGAGLPVMFVFFGDLTNAFTEFGRYEPCMFTYNICFQMNVTNLSYSQWNVDVQPKLESFKEDNLLFVYYFIYLACAVFLFGTIQVAAWSLQSIRQTKRLRIAYFRAILRQDISYHDQISSGELNTRLSSDIKKVKDGIGEKVSMVIQYVSMAVAGIAIGVLYAWKLGLVTLAVAPLLMLSGVLLYSLSDIYTKRELSAYAKAGAIAEETISYIKTVVAFGCQETKVQRYIESMERVKRVGILKGFMSGLSNGLLYISMYGMFGLSFWYGSTLVIAGEITAGNMTTSFFGILIASFALGTGGSYFTDFSEVRAAAAVIFNVIDQIPEIDVFSEDEGYEMSEKCNVKFDQVSFAYPSRPDLEVLKDISFSVEHGQTVALVGASGSGKSTIVQLIQRFYDTQNGKVIVGGRNVRTLSVRKLRGMIGVVAQEPVLFETTVAENIRWGRTAVTDDDIYLAAKQARVYDFIRKLPEGFNTIVGEGGRQFSGGEKQRVAIARAIVRNPKILLLDEATSALDPQNEALVQKALQAAAANRTTIIVAHRLSTIRHAKKIIVLSDGKVAEEGTHKELLQKRGIYSDLTCAQAGVVTDNEEDETERKGLDHLDTTYQFSRSSSCRTSSTRWTRTWSSRIFQKPSSISLIPANLAKRITSPNVTPTSTLRRRDGSMTDSTKNSKQDPGAEENFPNVPFCRIIKMNMKEWPYMMGGCFFAALAGSSDPIAAIIFAEVLTIVNISDPTVKNEMATLYGLLFVALGIASFIAFTVEATLFAKSGMELTLRLRRKAFRSILRQEMAYFDDPSNGTGVLCNKLVSDAARVQGCAGVRLGIVIKNISSLGVALAIGFVFSWKLSLVALAFLPFIVVANIVELQVIMGDENGTESVCEDAGQIASEAIKEIRTVASLSSEEYVCERFVKRQKDLIKRALRRAILIGVGYGFSQCVIFFAFAASFRLGIELVNAGEVSYENVFKVLTAVFFGAMAIGQNSSFTPDYAEAKVSASRIFAIVDRSPDIDSFSHAGISPAQCKGELTLKSVSFRYPTRPSIKVLKGCDITIEAGKTLAFVGQSGCGKSTIIQLLERFYDPTQGQVLLDGEDVTKLNVSWLRQQIGLVSQEPVLFNESIKENIRYGDTTRDLPDNEIEEAARKANAYNFIFKQTLGYSTLAGEKGGQLSGGEKQRVAIARALIRNPKILLLDEATSALDVENEKAVQAALDHARIGRTTVVVAHRLSTIRNADRIAVIDRGVVAEVGTHEELITKRGIYFSLINAKTQTFDSATSNSLRTQENNCEP